MYSAISNSTLSILFSLGHILKKVKILITFPLLS